ncbi:MAG: DUF1800 family protein [Hyphomicrobiales bacterium]|nr:DUF1800 family protein [Hyphomicrobiales bacterium]MDE2113677.1 DUF1800 family protein [Hyphomicrobiales bacterium]
MTKNSKAGFIALNRFGYGAHGDGDLAAAASDPRGILKSEISQPGIALLDDPQFSSTTVLLQKLYAFQKATQMARKAKVAAASASAAPAPDAAKVTAAKVAAATNNGAPQMQPDAMMDKPKMAVRQPPNIVQQTIQAEAQAKIQRALGARVGLAERLVAFWSNHFCISLRKSQLVAIAAGSFEREAIRPHIFGHFADMLLAVEQHPAMLNFLDNAQSIGPNSPTGLRAKRGLNENLAREIMELHTMGAGSGYTQADVTSFAKVITGWSIVGPPGKLGTPGSFVFNRFIHEPGPQTILGKSYPQGDITQGEAALRDFSRRPATAHFIATKLAQHFIADAPPPALVARLADTFTKTDGDLRAVTLALIDADESWQLPLTKLRSPYDFLIAATRAGAPLPMQIGPYFYALRLMGMGLWAPPGPNGWPDTNAAWASPEGMKQRLDIAARWASVWQSGANPSQVLEALAGDYASRETQQAVARAPSRPEGFALLLMSPELQRS